ncbi:MAG TPA: pilus assembly protein TadG-related protein, partial [Terriglobales bacterium]
MGKRLFFYFLRWVYFSWGGIGLAVDMSNLWTHRQSAQSAADSACTAAAMDIVNNASGAAGNTWIGSSFTCSGNSSAPPCFYAAKNGYAASGLVAGRPSTEINIDFPSSVPGVQTCSGTTPPPSICTETGFPANAFVRATVTDRIQSFFVGLLSGRKTMDVGAAASCGAVLSAAPIPILVLNPTLSGTFNLGGTGTVPKITIFGGPQRSIQVNSSNSGAVAANGNPIVNLSQGGPNLSGSDMGVTGGPGSPPFVYQGSPPGQYLDPVSPISDPFALLPVPSTTGLALNPAPAVVAGQTNGCPEPSTSSCYVYSPGHYTSGICVGKG